MSLRRSSRLVANSPRTTLLPPASLPATINSLDRKRKTETEVPGSSVKKHRRNLKLQPDETKAVGFKKPQPRSPATPAKRSRPLNPSGGPPLTPTPSLINVLKAPYSTGDIDDATPPPPPVSRPADPHITNATLVTPRGTQVTALYPHDLSGAITDADSDTSPTKQTSAPAIPTTVGTLLEKAQAHLISVDARFIPLIEKHRCAIFCPEGLAEKIDPFRSLTSGICGQQVSGAAAKAIKNKFVALYNEGNDGVHIWPTPNVVSETSIEKLRTAGLSQRKAEYVQGLAQKFVSGELTTQMLLNATDEEIMQTLTAVRGLGKWSVEMFTCFGLKRMDILSTGDLGVQRGMAAFFGKDVAKLKAKGGGKWKYMSEQDMLEKSEPYRPYRSLFMWYMWRVEDVDTAVLEA